MTFQSYIISALVIFVITSLNHFFIDEESKCDVLSVSKQTLISYQAVFLGNTSEEMQTGN